MLREQGCWVDCPWPCPPVRNDPASLISQHNTLDPLYLRQSNPALDRLSSRKRLTKRMMSLFASRLSRKFVSNLRNSMTMDHHNPKHPREDHVKELVPLPSTLPSPHSPISYQCVGVCVSVCVQGSEEKFWAHIQSKNPPPPLNYGTTVDRNDSICSFLWITFWSSYILFQEETSSVEFSTLICNKNRKEILVF